MRERVLGKISGGRSLYPVTVYAVGLQEEDMDKPQVRRYHVVLAYN